MGLDQPLHRIGRDGSVLVTRGAGKTARIEIVNALDACRHDVLYLDFDGVDIIDYSFADEAIAKTISRLLTGEMGDKCIVLINLDPAWIENIDVALKQRQIAALTGSTADWDVLGTLKDHLRETLSFVINRQFVTARELGQESGLNVSAANNRLAELWRQKLVRRSETIPPGGGRQYVYGSLLA